MSQIVFVLKLVIHPKKFCLKPVHLAKERAQIAKNKAFGRKNMSFSIIHTTTSLGAITALLIRSMELMEAKKARETYTHVFMNSAAAVAEVSTRTPGRGGRQSILVTQSAGQAPLETQQFGRTTAFQKGPGGNRTPEPRRPARVDARCRRHNH